MKIRSAPERPQEVPLGKLASGTCFTQPHIGRLLLLTSTVQGNCGYCCCLKSGSMYWVSLDAPVVPAEAEVVIIEGGTK